MTVMEAISQVDNLKFNSYGPTEKVKWLTTLDATVMDEVIQTHEGGEDIVFNGYDANDDMQKELLVKAPFDEIYLRWMEAMIDYHNGEITSYNASKALFNAHYEAFKAWYGRTHMPKQRAVRFMF